MGTHPYDIGRGPLGWALTVLLFAFVVLFAPYDKYSSAVEVGAVALRFEEGTRRGGARRVDLIARVDDTRREVRVPWDGSASVVPGERLVLLRFPRSVGGRLNRQRAPELDEYELVRVEVSPERRLGRSPGP